MKVLEVEGARAPVPHATPLILCLLLLLLINNFAAAKLCSNEIFRAGYVTRVMCTANRQVLAAVNSSVEFICHSSSECISDIRWSYLSLGPVLRQSPEHNNRSLLTPTCLTERRCRVHTTAAMEQSLLSIDQVQLKDAGTHLCLSGRMDQHYCEMSFNLTGRF